jgi:hypothetical protein
LGRACGNHPCKPALGFGIVRDRKNATPVLGRHSKAVKTNPKLPQNENESVDSLPHFVKIHPHPWQDSAMRAGGRLVSFYYTQTWKNCNVFSADEAWVADFIIAVKYYYTMTYKHSPLRKTFGKNQTA